MSEKLSDLISMTKQPETYLNRKEVYSSIKGKMRPENANSRSFRPQRILNRQNLFIVFTGIPIVVLIVLRLLFTTLPQEATESKEPIQKLQRINSQPDINDSMELMVNRERNSIIIIKDTQSSLNLEKDLFNGTTLQQDSSRTVNFKTAFDQSTYHIEPEDLGINVLDLDSTTLSCLGIQKKGGQYRIGYMDAMGYLSSINLMNGQTTRARIMWTQNHHGQITDEKLDVWGFRPIKLMGISSELEFKPKGSNMSSFFGSKLDQGLIERLLSICVPVRIKLDSIPLLRIKEQEAILWIVADNELFSCLPDSISIPMKSEFEANILPWMKEIDFLMDTIHMSYPIRYRQPKAETGESTKQTEPSQPIPCFYFQDLCEGLPGLDYVTVYPNPASDFVKVDVILNREKKIAYRIFDISGRVLFDDLTTRYDGAGRYTETIDISYFTTGIYILMLSDGEGANLTKRLMKN